MHRLQVTILIGVLASLLSVQALSMSDDGRLRVLAIDGGGVRGIIPAIILRN